jgi:hypothetical protein
MRKIILLIAIAISSYGYSQNDVTFKVDMNDYTGTFTEIQLNGTFNGWCGSCNPMTDDDADGVWEVTLPIDAASIEYKFTFDNWTGQETLAPGLECTLTTDAFTNRYLEISGDTILPVVCWESCVACTGMPTTADVTFKVDMDGYTGSYTTVNLNGVFNGWCGSCAEMTDDDGDNVYELTVNVSTGTIEYKFTVDGWTDQEMFTEGDPCTSTIDGFTNRTLDVTEDAVLDVVCWNSCAACVVGIEENWLENVLISPNPNNGTFNIKADLISRGEVMISISDIQGKIIYQSRETNNELNQNINLTDVEEGIYLLTISSQAGSITEKIFVR